MRLLSLDYDPVYGPDATRSTFAGDLSVFDYDAVIWDPQASFHTYLTQYESYFKNLPSLSEHRSVQIVADIRRRRSEFVDFINSGRALAVLVRPPQECYIDSGERTYSGTGRNRQTTQIVKRIDLMSALPVAEDVKFIAAVGTRIEIHGGGPITQLLRKYGDRLSYEAVIANPPGTPLAHVAGTDRHVASVQRGTSGGCLMLLPVVNLQGGGDDAPGEDDEPGEPDEPGEDEGWDDDGGWAECAPEFQTDLLAAIEQLSGGKVISRPEWASRFSTSRQSALGRAIAQQQAKIEAARKRLANLQRDHEEAEARDQLFLGTGRALELEVKAVLELLGGEVIEPTPGRDDWRVNFPEGKAVVEVKGVSKSAAERHAAQLEKWVASALEEIGESPKGILVVNTWRAVPLDERTGSDFPDQMLPYCKNRTHCLVTGLQLFVIREEVEAEPSRAEYWRKKLLQTSGRLTGGSDWAKYIETAGQTE